MDQVREIARDYGGLGAWPETPDYLDHERTSGRLLVATEGERVLGFGAVLEREGVTHLGDLFIRPDHLGRGLGKALLSSLFAGAGDRTTYASGDPRALPLYVRFGMLPWWPLLYLKGDRAAAARLPGDPIELVAASPDSVARLDRALSGRMRPADFTFLAQAGASLLIAPSVRGYGSVRIVEVDGRREAFVAPAGAASEGDGARLLIALVRHAGQRADVVNVPPFGPHPALPALLAAGFQVGDRDTFMASRPSLIDPRRYVASPEVG